MTDILRASAERIASLNRSRATGLAKALLALATHADCPQWVRNAAEGAYIEAVTDQRVADERRKRK